MARAFVFPGQGSQSVGMGREISEAFSVAKLVFEEVDDALNQKLSRIIFEGPEEELTLTENAQPAIMATSIAVLRVLEQQGGLDISKAAKFVAGHSLGEYTALTAAKAMDLSECAKLLKLRGQAMQLAVPEGLGAMAAIIGIDPKDAKRLAEAAAGNEVCDVSNDNAPGQIVLSGDEGAINRAIALASEFGAKKAVKLNVSAPFHCRLMLSAANRMKDALVSANLKSPVVPVISNVTAQAVSDVDSIRDLLVDQVTGMVRWRESVEQMVSDGVSEFVEIGHGKVLAGMIRRISKDSSMFSIESAKDIESFLRESENSLKAVA